MRDKKPNRVAVATLSDVEDSRPRVVASGHAWLPRSGYGPYCTIPIVPDLPEPMLRRAGLQSIAGMRAEAFALASEYSRSAIALRERSKAERLEFASKIVDQDGIPLIRPYRVRLCVITRNDYLYIFWRGLAKTRKGWMRHEAPNWSCKSRLEMLLEGISPQETALIERIEGEAIEIRLKWFSLVRMVHYANVVIEQRVAEVAGVETTSRMARLRDYCATSLARLWRNLD